MTKCKHVRVDGKRCYKDTEHLYCTKHKQYHTIEYMITKHDFRKKAIIALIEQIETSNSGGIVLDSESARVMLEGLIVGDDIHL